MKTVLRKRPPTREELKERLRHSINRKHEGPMSIDVMNEKIRRSIEQEILEDVLHPQEIAMVHSIPPGGSKSPNLKATTPNQLCHYFETDDSYEDIAARITRDGHGRLLKRTGEVVPWDSNRLSHAFRALGLSRYSQKKKRRKGKAKKSKKRVMSTAVTSVAKITIPPVTPRIRDILDAVDTVLRAETIDAHERISIALTLLGNKDRG